MFTNIKYGNTGDSSAIPSYIQNMRIAAKVLSGCAVHDITSDTRAAARFSIEEARHYLQVAEDHLNAIAQEKALPEDDQCVHVTDLQHGGESPSRCLYVVDDVQSIIDDMNCE